MITVQKWQRKPVPETGKFEPVNKTESGLNLIVNSL